MEREVERYGKQTRVLHWVNAVSFSLLFLTGLVLFLPPLAVLAQDGWTRAIHRLAAVIFIVAPLAYMAMNWKTTWHGIKEAFSWGPDDMGWFLAAPRYYFLADEEAMPPQGHMNTGQKMWWLMTIVFSVLFIVTGLVMWLAKTTAPAAVLRLSVFIHDVSFITTATMLFVHVYLSVAHPMMRPLSEGAWSSMYRGKVSAAYARSHHARWYEEVVKNRLAPAQHAAEASARPSAGQRVAIK